MQMICVANEKYGKKMGTVKHSTYTCPQNSKILSLLDVNLTIFEDIQTHKTTEWCDSKQYPPVSSDRVNMAKYLFHFQYY